MGDDFCDDFFRSPYGKGDEKLVWATILVVAQCYFSCSVYMYMYMYMYVFVYGVFMCLCTRAHTSVSVYVCVCIYIYECIRLNKWVGVPLNLPNNNYG